MYILFSCLHECMCTTCMPDALGDQKRVLDPMELELLMVVNHPVGAENRTQVLFKSNKHS